MAIREVEIVAKFLTHFRRVLRLAPVILETFGLSGMNREGWKRGELVHDETGIISLVFPVFHYGVGIEVPPLKNGGRGM